MSEPDSPAITKAFRRLQRLDKEQRFLRKRSEDYVDVMEEVFDRSTLLILNHLMNKGYFTQLWGAVGAGKESKVYRGVTKDGRDVAVKIALTTSAGFRKRLPYIEGDPRFTSIKPGIRNIVTLWVLKEFKNLQEAFQAGVPVPRPIAARRNVLVMEFVGDGGVPAPLLAADYPRRSDYRRCVGLVKRLYRDAHMVHGDLSEYNIFRRGRELIIFDLGSAVHVSHPGALDFLARDLANINTFFQKRGEVTRPTAQLLKSVISQ